MFPLDQDPRTGFFIRQAAWEREMEQLLLARLARQSRHVPRRPHGARLLAHIVAACAVIAEQWRYPEKEAEKARAHPSAPMRVVSSPPPCVSIGESMRLAHDPSQAQHSPLVTHLVAGHANGSYFHGRSRCPHQ